AALSTADGLLLAIANALSHDVYYKMIDPKASTVRRLVVARALLVVVAVVAAATASTRPSGIIQMVAWAFSLAAAGLFVPVVMGIWWKKTTNVAAVTGMLVGFFICLYYLVMTRYYPAEFKALWGTDLWFGITNISAAIFGMPVGFLITWGLSHVTEAPSKEMQDFVDSIRRPKGAVAWTKDAVHE
ncbi:MAG: cation acetate symporter, partial [Pseudomonadota bacterium]